MLDFWIWYGFAKTGLIAHDTNTKAHQYTIKFYSQNEVVFSGMLLLVAFPWPIGNPCN